MSDDFVHTVLAIVLEGSTGPNTTKIFGILGLLKLADQAPSGAPRLASYARQLLWHESNSQLAMLTFASSLMDASQITSLASAIFDLLAESNAQQADPPLTRGEKYVAVAWLRSLDLSFHESLEDLVLRDIVPPIPKRSVKGQSPPRLALTNRASPTLTGTSAAFPTGPIGTAIGALTGWLLVRRIFIGIIRVLLAYRSSVEITITEKGLEVHEETSLLG